MPETGVVHKSKEEILSFEEIEEIIGIFKKLGIKKLRFTGGEPFVRKGFPEFLQRIDKKKYTDTINITTNGIFLLKYINQLLELDSVTINLSLDSLRRRRFEDITRYDKFDDVWNTFQLLLEKKIPLKINTVVQQSINDDEIIDFVKLAENYPIEVRFIEEMPFNGTKARDEFLDYIGIYNSIRNVYPLIRKTGYEHSTSDKYIIPGFKGTIGIIAAYSRTFCENCNRIRLTPEGDLKWCLYDSPALNLRDILRGGLPEEEIISKILESVKTRKENGFESELLSINEIKKSMSLIGG